MFCDYHVHTHFSDDSEYVMEDVIKDAIRMNMNEICFTDHVDYGIKVDQEFLTKDEILKLSQGHEFAPLNVHYSHYFKEIERLRKIYSQITIKQGMEFGIQTHTIPLFQKLFNQYDFDFIILSCHQVEDKEFWTQDFQRGKTQQEYNLRYYQEILNVITQYKDYSVLGHLDLIARYDRAGNYSFQNIKSIVTEILKIVIQEGKGIEINTSSYRYNLKDLTPSRDILKLYKELGGKIITIGSDSHKKEHLGAYIKETKKELKTLGFEYYCTFKNMEPIFHKL
ncbi:histidinol-phosphatase HisJ family protein [Allocoprobacillus halotolerans]|uniref:Histidinol-phosphatase n=1 Tax=Allocoprobacillus halotolerans TaxID=2944914 RepID=A0ABY5I131_9FIRM|nr:histidinol-phosphatase HisJ family protein [Allocoprobacillus halotolerans]UTY39068.1 histidinol-phosphatase HisJ family protein [Allocoprobacillus halotolerans]